VSNGGLRYLPYLVQGPCPQICSAKGVPARPPCRRATGSGKPRLATAQAKGWAPWALDRRTGQAMATSSRTRSTPCLPCPCLPQPQAGQQRQHQQATRPAIAGAGHRAGLVGVAWPMVGFGVCLAWCRGRALGFAARKVFLPAPLSAGHQCRQARACNTAPGQGPGTVGTGSRHRPGQQRQHRPAKAGHRGRCNRPQRSRAKIAGLIR
jgi:hypothetical protein